MKNHTFKRIVTFVLAAVMVFCAAPHTAVFAEYSDDVVKATPSLKAINVYADEAMTEKIDDLSTLKAGVRYFYTLECEPGEMLKSVGIAAKDADDKSFVAPCDGEAGFTICEAKIIRPGDVGLTGKMNAKHVTTIMKYLIGASISVDYRPELAKLGYFTYNAKEIVKDNADFNLDGKVNAKDVIAMMRYLVSSDPAAPSGKLAGGVQSGFEVRALAGVGGVSIPSNNEAQGAASITVTDSAALEARIPGELDGIEKSGYSNDMPYLRSFFGLDGELSAKSALVDAMGIRRFLDDENRWLSWTVYLPVRAENDAEKGQTVIKLLGVEIAFTDCFLDWDEDYRIFADGRINDFNDTNYEDDVIFSTYYFGGVRSTSPAAALLDGCFYDDLRYEVEYVNACEYYGFERPWSEVSEPYFNPIPDTRTFAEKEIDYAFDTLREIAKAKGLDNIMISPLSLQLCLALAANGAKNETLRGTEELAGLTLSEINNKLADYARSLNVRPSSRYPDFKESFNVANSVWFRDGVNVNNEYVYAVEDRFIAEHDTVPFDQTTVERINNWVDEETYGMIKNLFKSFPENIAALLVNVIAFEGQWSSPFRESNTTTEKFLALTGFYRDAEMLNQTSYMKYLENAAFTGFVKPYRSHYAFVALLPKYCWDPSRDMIDPYDPLDKLTAESWSDLFSTAITARVTLKMPKFKNEYDFSVTEDLLKGKTLPALFDEARADLSGMATSDAGNIYISMMKQKTVIELDEKGTKAAAVTYGTAVQTGGIQDYPEKSVILDRPFIYAIIDTNTNIPVFVGTLTDVSGDAE